MFSTNFSGSSWARATSSPLIGAGSVVGRQHEHGPHRVVGLGGQLHGGHSRTPGRALGHVRGTIGAMADVNSGLEGVLAAETTISLVDGPGRAAALPRLRDRRPGRARQLRPRVAAAARRRVAGRRRGAAAGRAVDDRCSTALRGLPTSCAPLDALRTGFSAFGAERRMDWPPTPEQARELIALAPAVVGAFARLRDGHDPVDSAEAARPRHRRTAAARDLRRAARCRQGAGARRLLHGAAPSTA